MDMEMKIVKIPIDELKPYKKNAKQHTDKQVQHIVNSIKRFGHCDPIGVWGDNNIIVEGVGRYLAHKQLGTKEVECIRLNHLSDEERRAYALVHNQTTLETGWDFCLLNDELGELLNFDMPDFGFEIIAGVTPVFSNNEINTGEFSDDEFKHECPKCHFRFN